MRINLLCKTSTMRGFSLKNLTNLARLPKCVRTISTQKHTYDEVRIPVPWGHIAGKWWGPQDKRPILALHGWQDNSGTFDTLIPYLPKRLGFLAIDMPGHGLSSQLPPGTFYHGIDGVIIIRRLMQYFNWPKLSLLGHSLGAITSYTYTTLYPDTVDLLICLDGFKPLVFEDKKIDRMTETIEKFLKYDKLNNMEGEPPSYPFEMLEKLLHEGTRKSIALETCKYILHRNVAPSRKDPNLFYFTRDARLKVSVLLGMAQKDLVESARGVVCPMFLSKAHSSSFFERKEHVLEVLDVIKKSNKYFEFHAVEGTHHVHLNNPERLEGLINDFIKKYDVGDRSVGGFKTEIMLKSSAVNT